MSWVSVKYVTPVSESFFWYLVAQFQHYLKVLKRLYSTVLPLLLCQRSVDYVYVGLCLGFQFSSVSLNICPFFGQYHTVFFFSPE